ncbi:LemA family protein [uncultured Rhodoferax sp.]|mgnify:CR=1 FL=1|uniref:LemA family protein n=1 Tax=uncultured Rhodoferax sp. TaxID=223188 RepID=UPI0025D95352|nr:LemA family protein [uncultured Rhodoferax sp.]
MDVSLLLWLLLAVLLFWSVGLYNRLMRLRARGLEVWAVVEKHARACAALVGQALAHTEDVVSGALQSSVWSDLQSAASHLEHVLSQPRLTPLLPADVRALSEAWAALYAAWSRGCAAPHDLAGPVMPADMLESWAHASNKVQSASGGYNQIVARYNEAIQQYPARWVAGIMGFEAAGVF